MSTFRVDLFQGAVGDRLAQGSLDSLSQSGSDSKQRTVFITGPTGQGHEYHDGISFTGCNYYKKFCYPTMAYNDAILVCTSDDGSIFDYSSTSTSSLVTSNVTVASGSAFSDNTTDILSTTGGYAPWISITNSANGAITVRLNGSSAGDFSLASSATFTATVGELLISSFAFSKSTSGSATVTVQYGLNLVCS